MSCLPPKRGPANGGSVLDLMGPQRYVRGLLKLHDRYRPGTLPELYERGFRWWVRHFFGRWSGIDERLVAMRLTRDPTLELVRNSAEQALESIRKVEVATPESTPVIPPAFSEFPPEESMERIPINYRRAPSPGQPVQQSNCIT